jgi:phosphoglycolate phosphatase
MKLIVFDFDGTLADVNPVLEIIARQAAEKFHLTDITPERLKKARNMTAEEIIHEFRIPFFMVPAIATYVKYQQKQMVDRIQPVSGIENVLRSLSQKGYNLGIITSNNADTVTDFVKSHTIDLFSFIHSELNLFGKHKALRHLMEDKQIKTYEMVYIGDEVRDIEACQKVGVPIISVTWGFNGKRILKKYKPDYLVDKPEEIISLITEIKK